MRRAKSSTPRNLTAPTGGCGTERSRSTRASLAMRIPRAAAWRAPGPPARHSAIEASVDRRTVSSMTWATSHRRVAEPADVPAVHPRQRRRRHTASGASHRRRLTPRAKRDDHDRALDQRDGNTGQVRRQPPPQHPSTARPETAQLSTATSHIPHRAGLRDRRHFPPSGGATACARRLLLHLSVVRSSIGEPSPPCAPQGPA